MVHAGITPDNSLVLSCIAEVPVTFVLVVDDDDDDDEEEEEEEDNDDDDDDEQYAFALMNSISSLLLT